MVFTSSSTGRDNGYEAISAEMDKMAKQQEGFLNVEYARNEIGITASYWKSTDSI